MSKFDPMTGELIPDEEMNNEAEGEIIGYDPMTGEPIRKAPQTEEVKEETEGEIVGYDPMTGEPIRKAPQTEEVKEEFEQVVGYDPMTGEPIRANTKNNQSEMNFDPMTGLPMVYNGGNNTYDTGKAGVKKSGNKKFIWAIGAVILVAIVIVVLVGVGQGWFLSKGNKVLLATANTFKGTSKLVEDLDATGILASGKYTIGAEVEAEIDEEDFKLEVMYADNKKEKRLSGECSYYYIPDIGGVVALTESELKFQGSPIIDDYVFIYNYIEEKDGEIIDLLDELLWEDSGEACIELVDYGCQKLYTGEEFVKEIAQVVREEYELLEFEKVDKKEFEIGGKDRKCKGYRTEITEDNLVHILENLQELVKEDSENLEDLLEEITGESVSAEDLIDEIADEIDFSDIELTFYIYRNKLACIEIEAEEDFELLFIDEDKNSKSIELVYEDEKVLEFVASSEGHEEHYSIESIGAELGSIEYDYKSGDFEFEILNGVVACEGSIQSDTKEKILEISDLEVEGENFGSGIVYVRSGAEMQEFDGEEFDVGNASESDFEDLGDELTDVFELLESL